MGRVRFKSFTPTPKILVGGFTLIEVLLTIAIMVLLLGLSLPVYQLLNVRSDLENAAFSIVQTARRAQALSEGVSQDSAWGVKVQTGSVTLYKGPGFASREQSADEQTALAPEVIASGLDDVNFAKVTGTTSNSGTISLSTRLENKNITVNEKGAIQY